jgi:hypothetical protein
MRRILLAVAAIVTIAVGLGVHALGSGFAADAAGDALYGVTLAAGVDHALLERRIRDDAGDRDAV